jgi:hypothetical protein
LSYSSQKTPKPNKSVFKFQKYKPSDGFAVSMAPCFRLLSP